MIKASFDHIWEIKMNNFKSVFKIVEKSSKIEKFRVDNQPFIFLSDHFGVSCKISY